MARTSKNLMREATIQARTIKGNQFGNIVNSGRLQKLVPSSPGEAPLHHLRRRALDLEVAGPVLADPLVETHIRVRGVDME